MAKPAFSFQLSAFSSLFSLIALVVADRLTKIYMIKQSAASGFVLFPGFFEFTQHQNYGAIANFPLPLGAIFILTAAALILILRGLRSARKKSESRPCAFLILILAGAFGNLWDRVQYGYVFDWILIFGRSALNLADIFIILGLIGYLFSRHFPQKNLAGGDDSSQDAGPRTSDNRRLTTH